MEMMKRSLRSPWLHFTALAASAFLMTGCFESSSDSEDVADDEEEEVGSSKSDRDAIRTELSELRAKKKDLEGQIRDLEKNVKKKDELVATELKAVEEQEAARAYARSLDALNQALDVNLQAWREGTRRSFIGVTLPELVTVGGETYTGVTVAGVTDDQLAIQHAGGQANIMIVDLPVALRKNLIHEPTVLSEIAP